MKPSSMPVQLGNSPEVIQTSCKHRSISGWLAVPLLCATIGTASAADLSFMAVLKGQNFSQSEPSVVALLNDDSLHDEDSLRFEAFVQGIDASSLVSGILSLPNGGTMDLLVEEEDNTVWRDEYQADSLLDLDTVKPNGTYTFNLTTKNDGTKIVPVALMGDAYPNAPQITNFNTLQAADHTAEINIQWAAMTNGTAYDMIMCNVYDLDTGEAVYESGGPGSPGALNGTAGKAVIPAGTLSPGMNYGVEVLFVRVVDVNPVSYPNAIAVAVSWP